MGYIDADKFAERIKVSPAFRNINDGLLLQRVVIDLLNNIPTADVVPKSEYDAVVSAVDNSTNEFLKLHDKYQEAKREVDRLKFNLKAVIDEIPETKSEVAREIFEELEDRIEVSTLCSLDIEEVKGIISDLKWKYTEEKYG